MRLAIALLLTACSSGKQATAVPAGSGAGTQSPDVSATADSGSAAATDEPVVTDGASATANTGKAVAVHGTARNAKLGAVVVATGVPVYCLGIKSWPSALANKPIVARGKLEQSTEFAAPSGAAGTSGAVWVLRDCRYETP